MLGLSVYTHTPSLVPHGYTRYIYLVPVAAMPFSWSMWRHKVTTQNLFNFLNFRYICTLWLKMSFLWAYPHWFSRICVVATNCSINYNKINNNYWRPCYRKKQSLFRDRWVDDRSLACSADGSDTRAWWSRAAGVWVKASPKIHICNRGCICQRA